MFCFQAYTLPIQFAELKFSKADELSEGISLPMSVEWEVGFLTQKNLNSIEFQE